MNDLLSLHLEPQILAQAFKAATPEERKRGADFSYPEEHWLAALDWGHMYFCIF